MGETTCLMQPFSYAAGISSEANEGNHVHALGQSISFGRFMSESLAWEKWSTFSHNKYVEEAEKFSRPGSVAQMKAFFEAHYKNLAARKAAALLEQANSPSKNAPQPGNSMGAHEDATQDSQVLNSSTQMAADKEDAKETPIDISSVDDDMGRNSDVKIDAKHSSKVENEFIETDSVARSQVLVENCVKAKSLSQIGLVDYKEIKEMELTEEKQMDRPLLKDFTSKKDDSTFTSKKKPAASSSKSFINGRASKVPASPAKPVTPLRARKEIHATPISKTSAFDSVDRKKSTPKSTHRSVSFTPVRELNKMTSTIIRKIDGSRVGSYSKGYKDCSTPLRTPNTVSMVGKSKHPLVTPQSNNRRAETPVHPSASGRKTVRSKWNFLPSDCSKFMSARKHKSESPSLSTPFGFRTEERAARRKERLEEKFNANQAQKVQLQATFKEKAETELKKLRKGLCFRARPLPDFYKERSTKGDLMEKVPLTHSVSVKPETSPTAMMIMGTSQVPQRSSITNTGSKLVAGKNSRKPSFLTPRINRITQENTSPNIQHHQ